MSSIGQEGDSRKYRRLRKNDYYVAKAAVEAERREVKVEYCVNCGREISVVRKNWGGFCFECKNE